MIGQITQVAKVFYDTPLEIEIQDTEETMDMTHVTMRLHFDNQNFQSVLFMLFLTFLPTSLRWFWGYNSAVCKSRNLCNRTRFSTIVVFHNLKFVSIRASFRWNIQSQVHFSKSYHNDIEKNLK